MNGPFLNLKGALFSLDEPVVMGIINVTPDSFYHESRKETEEAIVRRIEQVVSEGASIIDLGGYSSRPGAEAVTEEEEMRRLIPALSQLKRHYPEIPVSVDTFRASVARRAVEEYGVAMVNDISAGALDTQMFATIAELQVPYIIMHMRGTPQTMMQQTDYQVLMDEVMTYFTQRIAILRQMGVHDIIVDPGFGFSKTTAQNYQLMRSLKELALLESPLLVGVSRKSMISNVLGCDTNESLNGTTVLHTYAVCQGAKILRAHDVREAVEVIKIIKEINNA